MFSEDETNGLPEQTRRGPVRKGGMNMTLGRKIQEIRVSRGMSQEEFGEMLGATRQTVSKWELDQAVPDIRKIVAISRLFCVSTDDLLVNVTNFEKEGVRFVCGIYRKGCCEIVETEKLLLEYYGRDKHTIGARVYKGNGSVKKLTAICERDCRISREEPAFYAYQYNDTVYTNHPEYEALMGEEFRRERLDQMDRLDSFLINHGDKPLHTVSEVGIRRALEEWRKGVVMSVSDDSFRISLCTGNVEYIFSIYPQDNNIYCGCSYNVPFELGLKSSGQYFRMRNYKDNSDFFCGFFFDFGRQPQEDKDGTVTISYGQDQPDACGLMQWIVKRYTDDEIILQGCGGDEYPYRREESKFEFFL